MIPDAIGGARAPTGIGNAVSGFSKLMGAGCDGAGTEVAGDSENFCCGMGFRRAVVVDADFRGRFAALSVVVDRFPPLTDCIDCIDCIDRFATPTSFAAHPSGVSRRFTPEPSVGC